jgi:hypothetical protein
MVHNISEKERKIFMEMLKKEELNGSKEITMKFFFDFLIKMNFLTLISNKF